MDTLAFLQRVLASEGTYGIVGFNPKNQRPTHYWFTDINEMVAKATELDQANHNVYYAVASFNDESRKQTNVSSIKSFYMDIDCGPDKPFADWKIGLQYFGNYIKNTGLPKPMIVRSGNGLHAYWVLTDDVSLSDWLPVARAIKASIPMGEDGKAIFDPVVPADAARILRPIGMLNPKANKRASLLIDAAPVTIGAMQQAVAGYAKLTIPTQQAAKTSILAKMAVVQDYPPADPELILEKCRQLRWCVDNQQQVGEPLWYAMLGVAAHCENKEDVAKAWSSQHPNYDESATLDKMARWEAVTTGPATCQRFEQERPAGCAKCPFAGKIGSPARLGIQYVEVAPSMETPAPQVAAEVEVPHPFKRTAKGMLVAIDGVEVEVCDFEIYPVSYGKDEGADYEVARYHWYRRNVGWRELIVRQAYLVDGSAKEFGTAIADQGIVLMTKRSLEFFQMMLRGYLENLKRLKTISNSYDSQGWKENFTQFLLGGTVYSGDGSEEDISFGGLNGKGSSGHRLGGTLSDWSLMTSIIEKAKLPVHAFAMNVSLSAPFYALTGLHGITVNLYGPTGAGKTLAQLMMQSVWGDPTELHMSAKTTTNALYAKIATYHNLPVTIDEATMMPTKEIGELLYSVSQGRDKARLTRFAQEKETKTWSTPVTTSSNRSFATALTSAGFDSEAQAARLLELSIPVHSLFTNNSSAGRLIYSAVTKHYGWAGQAMVKHLLKHGAPHIKTIIEKHRTKFLKYYAASFEGQERYWEQTIMLADLAGEIAFSLGLIKYDWRIGTRYALEQLGAIRSTIKDNIYDAFDLLTEYLNEHLADTITVAYSGSGKGMVDLNRLPRNEVHIRFDLYRKNSSSAFDRGSVTLDRKHFKQWLASIGSDYRTFMETINNEGINVTPHHAKAYMTRDTPLNLGQQYVISINLNHLRLSGILTDADTAYDSSLIANLRVVK